MSYLMSYKLKPLLLCFCSDLTINTFPTHPVGLPQILLRNGAIGWSPLVPVSTWKQIPWGCDVRNCYEKNKINSKQRRLFWPQDLMSTPSIRYGDATGSGTGIVLAAAEPGAASTSLQQAPINGGHWPCAWTSERKISRKVTFES